MPWTEKELERLEAVWVQAYKWAWGLPRTTASDVFTLPAGMEYLRPVGVWHMEKEQWDLLWTGEQAFWKAVPHLLAAGYHTAEELTEPRRPSTGRPYKIPRLMAAQEGSALKSCRSYCRGDR